MIEIRPGDAHHLTAGCANAILATLLVPQHIGRRLPLGHVASVLHLAVEFENGLDVGQIEIHAADEAAGICDQYL